MFDAFKQFLDEFLPDDSRPQPAGAPSLRLAAAVLLMEVMRANGSIAPQEKAAAAQALREQFGLAEQDLQPLLDQAERESLGAYDYFRFTNPLDEQVPPQGKVALVEAMWRVAYADDGLGADENAVIAQVADLLHVTHGDYINAKLRARAASAPPSGPH
jgi:uncharacterized tellurite resistance protein B-like protein